MPEPIEEHRMMLSEHLEELRSRVILSILGLAAAFVLCWLLKDPIMQFVVRPHALTMRKLELPERLRIIRYPEGFYSYMKVCLVAAIFVSSPFVFYQIWRFVSVGLYKHERLFVSRFAPASIALFLAGGAFGYLALLPLGLRFLLSVAGDLAEPMITMGDYTSLIMTVAILLGLVFQLPLVMMLLAKIGLAKYETFSRKRRYAILLAFIVGAVLTPPDPFTQAMLALPMIGLYEIGITASFPSLRSIARLFGIVAAAGAVVGGIYAYFLLAEQRAVVVVAAGDSARVRAGGTAEESPLLAGSYAAPGTVMSSGEGVPLRLRFGSDTVVALNRQSQIRLIGRRRFRLMRGEILAKVRHRKSLQIDTADVILRLAEGEADVRITASGTEAVAVKGTLGFMFEGGRGEILPGRKRLFSCGGDPADVNDVIRWAR